MLIIYAYDRRYGLLAFQNHVPIGCLPHAHPRLRQFAASAARLKNASGHVYGRDNEQFHAPLVAALAARWLDSCELRPLSFLPRITSGSNALDPNMLQQGIMASLIARNVTGHDHIGLARAVIEAIIKTQKAGFKPNQPRVPRGNPRGW